jgi:hypothetical protein
MKGWMALSLQVVVLGRVLSTPALQLRRVPTAAAVVDM